MWEWRAKEGSERKPQFSSWATFFYPMVCPRMVFAIALKFYLRPLPLPRWLIFLLSLKHILLVKTMVKSKKAEFFMYSKAVYLSNMYVNGFKRFYH